MLFILISLFIVNSLSASVGAEHEWDKPFIFKPLTDFQGHLHTQKRVGQLIDRTFGRIELAPAHFIELKERLLDDADNIFAQMTTIGKKNLASFDVETDTKYRQAATGYMVGIYNEQAHQPAALQITAFLALAHGFDQVLNYLIRKGVQETPEWFITAAIPRSVEVCARKSEPQKKAHHILAVAYWLTYCKTYFNKQTVDPKNLVDNTESRNSRRALFKEKLRYEEFLNTYVSILATQFPTETGIKAILMQ